MLKKQKYLNLPMLYLQIYVVKGTESETKKKVVTDNSDFLHTSAMPAFLSSLFAA